MTLTVPEVPPETFVEARVLYPASALPAAPVIDQPRKQTVLDEEAKWANEANAARMKAMALVGLRGRRGSGSCRLRRWPSRSGRSSSTAGSSSRSSKASTSERTPRPDLPPAVVGALWRFGKVQDSDIAATLMNLADKGIIRMEPVVETTTGLLRRQGQQDVRAVDRPRRRRPELTGLDATLTRIIFDDIGEGGPVRLDDIKAYAKDNPKSFSESDPGVEGRRHGRRPSSSGCWSPRAVRGRSGCSCSRRRVVVIGWVRLVRVAGLPRGWCFR